MLEITRIDHIAMAVPEADPQVDLLERLFGFRKTGDWVDQAQGYRGVNLDVPGSSGVGWEVLEPQGPDSYLDRFLKGANGPGLHHVTLEVPDVEAAVAELRALGIEPWGQPSPDAGGRWMETYIHPRRGGNGLLFQLFGAEDSVPWHEFDRRPPMPDAEHTLGIVAINHLSHAHTDGEELARWYERVLGWRTFHRSPGGAEVDFRTLVQETATGQMRWEILEPGREDSFVQRFLEARGPAAHHVAFEVGDWDRAASACAHHGIPTFGERQGVTDGARWREAFIHPRHTGGMLAQFFWQERPGVWI